MAGLHFETDKEIKVIDCRDLFPPEPMERVLEFVETLKVNEAILMIHRKEPLPLYEKLEERHCEFKTKFENDGSVHVLIWKKSNEDR